LWLNRIAEELVGVQRYPVPIKDRPPLSDALNRFISKWWDRSGFLRNDESRISADLWIVTYSRHFKRFRRGTETQMRVTPAWCLPLWSGRIPLCHVVFCRWLLRFGSPESIQSISKFKILFTNCVPVVLSSWFFR